MKRTSLLVVLFLLAASLSFADQASTRSLQAGSGSAAIAVNIHDSLSGNAPYLTSTRTLDSPILIASGLTAPTITPSAAAVFTIGTPRSFLVMATGSPTPTMTYWGPLPVGLTFTDNGNATASLSGTPAAGTAGTYPVYITAANGVLPNAIQAFTLIVNEAPPRAPAITSDNNTTFTLGSAGTFTVTAIGSPTPALSYSGVLPAGVTFTDNHNGTATLAGTPATGTQGSYPFLITAANGISPNAIQPFALKVKSVPAIIVIPALFYSFALGGPLPPAQILGITSSGTELNYTVSTTEPWLSATPTSGTTPASISVSVNPAGLTAGVYHGTVSIASPGAENSPQPVAVTLTVIGAPMLVDSPGALTFAFTIGGSVPAGQSVAITSSGLPLSYTVSTSQPWLLATPLSGTTPGSMIVSVNPANLVAGTYHGSVIITSAAAANSPQSVPVDLTVTPLPPQPSFFIGFDMRDTQPFVADVTPNTYVLGTRTLYPTTRNGATFGWIDPSATSVDRNNLGDPRIAGVNMVPNYTAPGVFRIDLPGPGTYDISVAMGDHFYTQCWTGCRIEFKDGSTSLFVLATNVIPGGNFADANGQVWTADQWPANNTPRQVTLSGSTLTVVVGANNSGYGTYTPVAFVGLASLSNTPGFNLSASSAPVTVVQGHTATASVTTTVFGGFNDNVTLSASGLPSGVTASFSPNPLTAPGAGSSTLTFTASSGAALGSATVTVTATGGGLTHTATLNLTVNSNPPQPFAIGFDMRDTQPYVTDSSPNTYVLGSQTLYPTLRNGVTFGWTSSIVTSADRSNLGDPRLAGINRVANSVAPGVFRIDLPAPGTYNISVALGDRNVDQCWSGCRVEFKDGDNSLFVLFTGAVKSASFLDANGRIWTAAQWPASNTAHRVTLTGSTLTVVVGANNNGYGTYTPIAFIGVTQ